MLFLCFFFVYSSVCLSHFLVDLITDKGVYAMASLLISFDSYLPFSFPV